MSCSTMIFFLEFLGKVKDGYNNYGLSNRYNSLSKYIYLRV